MKIASSIIICCITLPIWYFLLYTLLVAAHVARLVWFLFWVYVPFSMTVDVIDRIAKGLRK